MISPALRFQFPYEVKLHENRNERISEDRCLERLKMKFKALRLKKQVVQATAAWQKAPARKSDYSKRQY
jgi:hypothetical protein